jgi:hypothetical protein
VRDIPASVLLELAARSLLIVRNCVVNSLGTERAAAVRQHRAYKVFVDWPLRAFHALAKLIRDRPVHGGVALGLLAYFSLAVLIDVVFFSSVVGQTGWRGYVAAWTFVGLPLICLAAATTLVIVTDYSWKALRTPSQRLARHLLIGLAGLALVLSCGAVVYLAYAYVSNAINPLLAPLLAQLSWWPKGFERPGDVVVLVVLAALSFGLGKWTQRRSPPSEMASSPPASLQRPLPRRAPARAEGSASEAGADLSVLRPAHEQRGERAHEEAPPDSPRSAPASSAPVSSGVNARGGSATAPARRRAK